MRNLYLVIVLSTAALLALGSIAIAQRGGVPGTEGAFNIIEITKTYDVYKVQCTTAQCREEGKCLGTLGDWTCTSLTLCGLQFDVDGSEYWVYEWPDEDIDDRDEAMEYIRDNNIQPIGYSVNSGEYKQASLTKAAEYGRVRYHLLVYVKNDTRTPSHLINATLCMATEATHNDIHYVGADYEQVADVYGGEIVTEVILPVPTNEDIGQNVILCPIECER
jgi:hypothetical protein